MPRQGRQGKARKGKARRAYGVKGGEFHARRRLQKKGSSVVVQHEKYVAGGITQQCCIMHWYNTIKYVVHIQ